MMMTTESLQRNVDELAEKVVPLIQGGDLAQAKEHMSKAIKDAYYDGKSDGVQSECARHPSFESVK